MSIENTLFELSEAVGIGNITEASDKAFKILSDFAECRYLYSSILGHYTTVNIAHCLEGLTTSIAVISGKNAPETFEKAEEYCNVLPSIEHIEIAGCGLLPQRENADAFLEQIDILLSDNC